MKLTRRALMAGAATAPVLAATGRMAAAADGLMPWERIQQRLTGTGS